MLLPFPQGRQASAALRNYTLVALITLASICLSAFSAFSQHTLELLIVDNNSNPIEGAVTFLNDEEVFERVSDSQGIVQYNLANGTYELISYAANYLDYQTTIIITGEDLQYQVSHPDAIHWTTHVTDAPIGVSEKNGIRVAAAGDKMYLWAAYGGVPGMDNYGGRFDFYEYNTLTDSWKALPDAPFSSAYGISTTYGHNTAGEDAIYILKGYWSGQRTWFARFNIAQNQWENGLAHEIPWRTDLGTPPSGGNFQNYPRNGAAMAFCPDEQYIYLFPGAGYTHINYDWYRYSIADDSWEDMGELPHRQGPGNAAVWVDGDKIGASQNYIYMQFGTGPSGSYTNAEFWRYGLNDGQWEQMTKHAYGADDGSMLVWDGNDYIFHTPGAYREQKWDKGTSQKREFMRYSISSNEWEEMEKTPYNRWGGWDDAGGMVLIGNHIYGMKGGDDVAWAEEGCDEIFDTSSPCVSGGGDIPNNQLWRYTIHLTQVELTVNACEGQGSTNLAEGATKYNPGTILEIIATPAEGWEFEKWTVNGEFFCNQNPSSITLDEDKELQAHFKIKTYTVEYKTTEGGSISGQANQTVEHGSDANPVEAIAEEAYSFIKWSDGVTTAERTDKNITQHISVTAQFSLIKDAYTLSVSANPADAGSISGAGEYEEGTQVNLTATAHEDYTFLNWTNAQNEVISTQADFTYTMPAQDITLTANFEEIPPQLFTLSLEIEPEAAGTLSGAGSYEEGTQVNLTATAHEDYTFLYWTNAQDEVISTQADFTYTMPAQDITLTANFEEIPPQLYTLSLEIEPEAAGILSGAGSYEEGTQVNLTATTHEGYTFLNWTNAQNEVISTQADFTYTMPAQDITLTANFEEIPPQLFTLSLELEPEAAGILSGAGSYEEGTQVNLTATAHEDYTFLNWTNAQNEVISTQADFTYTMPAQDITLTANFEEIPPQLFTLSLEIEPEAAGILSGAGSYEEGTQVNLTATAHENFKFLNWTNAQNEVISTQADFTYTMPAQDITLTANFEQTHFTISITVEGQGGVMVNNSYYFEEVRAERNKEINLEARAEQGWEFHSWTGCLASDREQEQIIMDSDKFITALFTVLTNTDNLSAENITVFPNPFQQTLQINNTAGVEYMYITGITGQKVWEHTPSGEQRIKVQTHQLSQGIYLLTLRKIDGSVQVKKIVKQ